MKIIGYKLVKHEYEKAAHLIAQIKFDDIVYESKFINRLEKAGVIDLWFEPIYETPQIPKGSDAERFVEMVGSKQQYNKDFVCGRITFSFDFLTTDRVYIHFDENGSFKRLNTIS
jgi:hypothetical protein